MSKFYKFSGYTIMVSGILLSMYLLFIQIRSGFLQSHLDVGLVNFIAKVVVPPIIILVLSFFPGRYYYRQPEQNKILLWALIIKVVSLAILIPPALYTGFHCLVMQCLINPTTIFWSVTPPLLFYAVGLIMMLVPLLSNNVE